MPREWKQWPEFNNVKTPWGLVRLAVTSATHVAIQSETKTAGFTLRTGLTLKSRTYKLCAHASLVGGHWEVKVYALKKMSESTEVSFAKHLSAFISEWADQNPEALEEAARVEYNNDLRSAEEKVQEAQATLDKAKQDLACLRSGRTD